MSETNNYPERQVDICDHEVFCVGGIRQFIYPASGYLEVDFTMPAKNARVFRHEMNWQFP